MCNLSLSLSLSLYFPIFLVLSLSLSLSLSFLCLHSRRVLSRLVSVSSDASMCEGEARQSKLFDTGVNRTATIFRPLREKILTFFVGISHQFLQIPQLSSPLWSEHRLKIYLSRYIILSLLISLTLLQIIT